MSPRASRLGPSRLATQGRAPHPPQRSSSSASRSATDGASTASVRRNLFPSHLSRRPTSDASSTSTRSTTILETPFGGPSHHYNDSGNGAVEYGSDEATTARLSPGNIGGRGASVGDAGSEIVVRGANGEYAVVLPTLPAMLEEKTEGFGGEMEDDGHDVDARLREMTSSRARQSQDPELLDALIGLLRRKVESLDEDCWMYQGDDLKPS